MQHPLLVPSSLKASSYQSTPPTSPILRLMIHTEDGMVPYLTPDLLQQHFPPSDLWCLGIAVNETCIAPIYATHNPPNTNMKKKKQPKKRTIDELHREQNTNVTSTLTTASITVNPNTVAVATVTRKPRGYTFSSTGGQYELDTWIYPYTRIVVPTFHNNKSNNDAVTSAMLSKSSLSLSSSMNGTLSDIRLWTSNGRHRITTSQYIDCAMNAIHGNIIVPLYPMDDEVETSQQSSEDIQYNNTNYQKTCSLLGNQKLIISQHTEAIRRMEKEKDEETSPSLPLKSNNFRMPSPQLCVPFLVSDRYCYFIDRHKNHTTKQHDSDNNTNVDDEPYTTNATDDTLLIKEATTRAHLSWMIDDICKEYSFSNDDGKHQNHNSTIIMMIGWHSITNVEHRWHILQSLHREISSLLPNISNDDSSPSHPPPPPPPPPPLMLGTISTCSTQQLLQLIEYSTLTTSCNDLVDSRGNDNLTVTSSSVHQNAILIGTNLPTIWAKTKRCFVIDTSLEVDDSGAPSPQLDVDGCYDFNSPITMNDVQDHIFYSDSRPLMKNCTCMTCSTYTRAYLYHLVCAKELLVEILLFIHNFHHMLHLIQVVNVYHTNKDIDSIKRLCLSIRSRLPIQSN